MAILSKPSAEKTRALREAVASYMDHVGLHDRAEFMRAQPDDFTQWSDYAHQLVTVMDKKTFQKDLPPNIEGMMDFSKDRVAARTAKNRALEAMAANIGEGKKGLRQSENVVDRQDKGRLPVEPSLLAQALEGAQEIGERGQRGFGKIIAALMGDGEIDTPQPRSKEDLARSIRAGYGAETWGAPSQMTIDKHAWDAAGQPFGGAWYDRGEQLMKDAWLEANRKDQSSVGGDYGFDPPGVPRSANERDLDGDGTTDFAGQFAAGGRQARPGMTVNSNTGAEFTNPSTYADPGLRAPASESFQRSMYGPLDIKGWSPTKAPTPASDVASKAVSKSAAKALAAALAGDTAQMGDPDATLSDVSTFGEFAGIPSAGSWGGEDGGDPEKEAIRAAAVADIDPNDVAMVDLVAPPTAPPAPNYGLDEAFRDAYAAVFGASETTPEALDVDITEGYGTPTAAASAAASMGRKASALGDIAAKQGLVAGDLAGPISTPAAPGVSIAGAPPSAAWGQQPNAFGVFGSEANFGTPATAMADVDPMTAFTRDISTPYGMNTDQNPVNSAEAMASLGLDGEPMGESMGLGDFAGIGSPTADQAEAQRGMPGLSMGAMSGKPAAKSMAEALSPGLDAFHDAFSNSVQHVGPMAKAAFDKAYKDRTIAAQIAAIDATKAYTSMNGLRNNPAVLGLRSQQIGDFAMASPNIADALGLSLGAQGTNSLAGGPFGGIGGMNSGPVSDGGGGFGGIGGFGRGINGPSSGSDGGSAGEGGGFGAGGYGGLSGPSAGNIGAGNPSGNPNGPSMTSSGSGGYSAGEGGSIGQGGLSSGPTGSIGAGHPSGSPSARSAAAASIAGALAGAEADRAEADAAAAASSDAARGFGGYGGYGGLGGGWF